MAFLFKMRIVSGQDFKGNDNYLRIMNGAGTGLGPGIEASGLLSKGELMVDGNATIKKDIIVDGKINFTNSFKEMNNNMKDVT